MLMVIKISPYHLKAHLLNGSKLNGRVRNRLQKYSPLKIKNNGMVINSLCLREKKVVILSLNVQDVDIPGVLNSEHLNSLSHLKRLRTAS